MKILLVGEFSRLHNSLKKGLQELGHQVFLLGDGDQFKNYPVDFSIQPTFVNKYFLVRKVKNLIYYLTKIDLGKLESYLRFLKVKPQLKDFDIVQFIHADALRLPLKIQLEQIKFLDKHNKKLFLLVCGNDYRTVKFLQKENLKYSLLTPYFSREAPKKDYKYFFQYGSKKYKNYYLKAESYMRGLIASDIDYILVTNQLKKNLGLIANPVIIPEVSPQEPFNKTLIFLGINRATSIRKGIVFFEKALEIISKKYAQRIKIKIVENIPYSEYVQLYNSAHIFLDMVYAYDQGYNALEAMAKGKVVFTGAEQEFLEHYHLKEDEVCINALPNVNYLVEKLSWLIENPYQIERIGKNARRFIEEHHDYKKVAQEYFNTWNNN